MTSESTPPHDPAAQEPIAHASAQAQPTSPHASSDVPNWERETLQRLVMASLEEQKQQRRWRVFFRLAWLLLFVAVLVLSFNKGGVSSSVSSPHTAVVQIKGEIAADSETSADSVIEALRSAFEEDSAKAVVLLINSPGGSPVQAGIINDEVRRLRTLHNKPVYAVIEEMGASAAYYIAVSADSIYVDKASIVGSIGVLMDGFGFNGLMDKLGIERRLLTAGENKGFLDPFTAESKSQKAFALAMLEQIHQQFIAVVRQGRGKRLHETPEIFSGLFWSGEEAIKLGLADELGSLDYVAREVIKAEDVVDYTHRDNVAERLAKRFGAEVGASAVKTLLAQHLSLK
jgi:protease-4